MDEAKAGSLHEGNARAKCPQQERPRPLLHRFVEVEIGALEIVALTLGKVEEQLVEVGRELQEKVHVEEGDREEAFVEKDCLQVLAKVESQLVLKDERSS